MDRSATIIFFLDTIDRSMIFTEPHHHKELNPHAPKLYDTIYGNNNIVGLDRDLLSDVYVNLSKFY